MTRTTQLRALPAGMAAMDLPMHLAALTRIARLAAAQAAARLAAQAAAQAARDARPQPALSAPGDGDPSGPPHPRS